MKTTNKTKIIKTAKDSEIVKIIKNPNSNEAMIYFDDTRFIKRTEIKMNFTEIVKLAIELKKVCETVLVYEHPYWNAEDYSIFGTSLFQLDAIKGKLNEEMFEAYYPVGSRTRENIENLQSYKI